MSVGAEGTISITEARSGGIMSQVENGDDRAAEANPLAFRRNEAPLNPPVPLQLRRSSVWSEIAGCMMSSTGFG